MILLTRSWVIAAILFVLFHPAQSAEEEKVRRLWREHVLGEAGNRILDPREINEMIVFSGQPNIQIPARDVAVASVLYRADASIIRGELAAADFDAYAQSVKGAPLNEKESAKVKAVSGKALDEFAKIHPGGIDFVMDVTPAIGFVRQFQRSLAKADTLEKAIAAVTRIHGYACDTEAGSDWDFSMYRECMERSIPVLIEAGGDRSICFGYVMIADTPHLILNHPGGTAIMLDKYRKAIPSESLNSDVIAIHRMNSKYQTKADYMVSLGSMIPAKGFSIEAFEKGRYTAHAWMNWRRSAEGWDPEIRQALALPPAAPVRPPALPAEPTDADTWKCLIQGQRERIGGNASLIDCTVLPADDRLDARSAAIATAAFLQVGEGASAFSLTSGKLYRTGCELAKDEFLMPDEGGAQVRELESLVAEARKGYEAREAAAKKLEKEGDEPLVRTALRFRLDPAAEMESGLKEIARWHGWVCLNESAANLSFDKYEEAVHKRIPIVLRSAEGEWLLGVGYLRLGGKQRLIVADPKALPGGKCLKLDRKAEWPASGLKFVEFSPDRFTPFFLHRWEASGAAWSTEVGKVFREQIEQGGKK